jgi:hypothetical protein
LITAHQPGLLGHCQCTPSPPHRPRGDRLSNGDLLTEAEADGFDLLITTDRRIRYQQNHFGRRIALIVLAGSTKWSRIQLHLQDIGAAVEGVTPGSYREVPISF